MSRCLVLGLVLAACHHARPPAPIDEPVSNDRAHSDDEVFLDAPTMLARGPDERTPRVRLVRYDHVWMHADGDEIVAEHDEDLDALVMPVSETHGTRVRVRYDAWGDAALLLWIDRASLGTVIIEETGVATGPNAGFAEAGGIGAWLRPGTPITDVRDAASEHRRVVRIEDDGLAISGEVAAAAVGDQWVPVPAPAAPESRIVMGEGELRAAGDRGAVVLAHALEPIAVLVAGPPLGDWTLVTTLGDHTTVHGYVLASTVFEVADGIRDNSGGYGFGTLKGDTVDVPEGACLYDAVDGALIGMATVHQTWSVDDRATGGDGHDWATIAIGTDWGDVPVVVHDLSDDPAKTAVELCDR